MGKKISYEEIGAVTATFLAAAGTVSGQVVRIAQNDTVGPCSAGETFCGAALSASKDGFAAVQVGGFVRVPVTGSVALGWTALTADGSGGVKTAGSTDAGRSYLVVSLDSTGGTAVILL